MKVTIINDDWKKADGSPDDLIYDMDNKPGVGDWLSLGAKGSGVLWCVTQVIHAHDNLGLYTGYGVRVEKIIPKA